MGKYRWIYLLSLFAGIVGYVATDRKQMLLLLVVLLAMLVVSVLLWIFTLSKIQLSMEVEDVSIIRQQISVKIVLNYHGIFPLGLITMDVNYENGIFMDSHQQQIALRPGKNNRLEYVLPYVPTDCGKTLVQINQIRCYDLLGIVCHTLDKRLSKEVIVYPDVKELEIKKSHNAAAKNFGEEYDVNQKGQDVSEVFDMREYQPGDSVKSIHWKLSGKLDKLIIREFSNPTNYHTALYYDMDVDNFQGAEEERSVQNGILQMTASMSRSMIQNGYTHHMISFEQLKESETLVEDNDSYLQMLAEMMCRRISQNRTEQNIRTQMLSQEKRFTKIIIVCGSFHMQLFHQLAEVADVTIICLNARGRDTVENAHNCSIISVPVEKMEKQLQTIEL